MVNAANTIANTAVHVRDALTDFLFTRSLRVKKQEAIDDLVNSFLQYPEGLNEEDIARFDKVVDHWACNLLDPRYFPEELESVSLMDLDRAKIIVPYYYNSYAGQEAGNPSQDPILHAIIRKSLKYETLANGKSVRSRLDFAEIDRNLRFVALRLLVMNPHEINKIGAYIGELYSVLRIQQFFYPTETSRVFPPKSEFGDVFNWDHANQEINVLALSKLPMPLFVSNFANMISSRELNQMAIVAELQGIYAGYFGKPEEDSVNRQNYIENGNGNIPSWIRKSIHPDLQRDPEVLRNVRRLMLCLIDRTIGI